MPVMKLEPKLFGLDLSRGLDSLHGLVASVCWRQGAWLRSYLDQPVRLYDRDAEIWRTYTNGEPTPEATTRFEGVLLPDDLVLGKSLRYPKSLICDLDSILALEIRAASPFDLADTVYGYCIESDNTHFTIHLKLASKARIASFSTQLPFLVADKEVWAKRGEQVICLSGFGEGVRENSYRTRVTSSAYLSVFILVMLFLIPAVPVALQHKTLDKMQSTLAFYQGETRSVISARNRHLTINDYLTELDQSLHNQWLPLLQLDSLTQTLGDDVWLSSFDLTGDTMKLDGRARNAAQVMSELTRNPLYSEVRSLAPMVRDSSGFERFMLEVTLRQDP